MKIVVIDNYDSFTYNLVHYLEDFNAEVTVFRNDEFELEELELDEEHLFYEFLNAAARALRSTYRTVLNATPGQLVFGRDMLLPIL